MYNLTLNNHYLNKKNSTIYTPQEVSEFLFNLLKDKFPKKSCIFDPCSGENALLIPWKQAGYEVWGNDNDPSLLKKQIPDSDLDFLTSERERYRWQPDLILCNPPFNGYPGKAAAEVWLDKIIELFGQDIPLVLFAPFNFRLPWKKDSKRLSKFLHGEYPPISSIISLPTKGLWEGVTFHSEILIFNIPGLQPHYFFNNLNIYE